MGVERLDSTLARIAYLSAMPSTSACYDGRVEFFNDEEYGPYHGSIIALTSHDWPPERIFSKQQAFGDICGIYYRYFRWADSGAVLWTSA